MTGKAPMTGRAPAAYAMTGRDPESTYERMHMRAAYAMTGRDPESPRRRQTRCLVNIRSGDMTSH